VLGFDSLTAKANWLDAAASLDALRAEVQTQAKRFLGYGNAEARTRAIQRWVRDNIKYQYDFRVSQSMPGEEFADTSSAISRGFGDCDDKARVFVALVRAVEMVRGARTRASQGVSEHPLRDPQKPEVYARIRPVFTRMPEQFVHVQAEVKWPRSELHENAMPGGWLLAELIVKGCEIGQDPDTVPRLPDGQRAIV
jgi:hypothetical protein